MDLRSLCPWCGKERHPTRAAALRAARRRERRRASHDLRLRAYRCPAGRGWHLGSRRPHYLGYLRTDLRQTRRARELAAEELGQAVSTEPSDADDSRPMARARQPGSGAGSPARPDIARRVFVVHGRDSKLTSRFFDLLRVVDLRPLEWEPLVQAIGRATPSLAEVVARAPHLAQATLVLLSPDDVVELHSDLVLDGDAPQDRDRGAQARPNVLFELGLAPMAYPDNTVIVEVGQLRPLNDLVSRA